MIGDLSAVAPESRDELRHIEHFFERSMAELAAAGGWPHEDKPAGGALEPVDGTRPLPTLAGLEWLRLDEVPEAEEWFIENLLLAGELNLLTGAQKDGKSTLLSAIIAMATRGDPDPANPDRCIPKCRCAIVSYEETRNRTLKKLKASGADLSVGVATLGSEDLPDKLHIPLDQIEMWFRDGDIQFLVLETNDFLDAALNRNSDSKVRPQLIKLNALARKYGATVAISGHPNKKEHLSATHQFAGAAGWAAVCRQLLRLVREPETDRRVLLARGNEQTEGDVAWYIDSERVQVATSAGDDTQVVAHFGEPAPYGFDDLSGFDRSGKEQQSPRRDTQPTKVNQLAEAFASVVGPNQEVKASEVLRRARAMVPFEVNPEGTGWLVTEARRRAGIEVVRGSHPSMWSRPEG